MRSPQPRAHPSPPSVSLLSPPLARSGFRHLDGYHTRRRSPPAGFATDRGRGSNPRGGTAAWSHPRRREVPHGLTEGGLLPQAPAGGIATPPRPSRPASHIHNHLSACPARACLPPVATPSNSALLARWQVPAPSRGVFQPPMPVVANVVDEGGDRRWQRGRRQPCHHPRLRRRRRARHRRADAARRCRFANAVPDVQPTHPPRRPAIALLRRHPVHRHPLRRRSRQRCDVSDAFPPRCHGSRSVCVQLSVPRHDHEAHTVVRGCGRSACSFRQCCSVLHHSVSISLFCTSLPRSARFY